MLSRDQAGCCSRVSNHDGIICPRDVLYLDLALESTARGIIEADMALIRKAAQAPEGLSQLASFVASSLQHACLSFGSNQEMILTLKSFKVSSSP